MDLIVSVPEFTHLLCPIRRALDFILIVLYGDYLNETSNPTFLEKV